MIVIAYSTYLAISLVMTVWVAKVLYRNGRAFLADAFRGNERLADSANQLLVAGFYLVNLGYAAWSLEFHEKPATVERTIELISRKFGWVLLVLGAMHFLNVIVFSWMRKNGLLARALHTTAEDQGIPTL